MPKTQRDGWPSVIPSSVLVFIAPMDETALLYNRASHPLRVELRKRADALELSAWQWQVMLDRYFSAHPEELNYLVETRKRWPEGVPLHFFLLEPGLVTSVDASRRVTLRARPRMDGGRWIAKEFGEYGWEGPDLLADAGIPPPGITELTFDVQLLVDEQIVWSGVTRSSIQVSGRISDVIEPVEGLEHTQWLERELNPRLVRNSDGQVKIWVDVIYYEMIFAEVDYTIGFTAEVLCDGEVAAIAKDYFELSGAAPEISWDRDTDLPTVWFVDPPSDLTTNGLTWEIRIRGDAEMALIEFATMEYVFGPGKDSSRYWVGEFTVPLTEIEQGW